MNLFRPSSRWQRGLLVPIVTSRIRQSSTQASLQKELTSRPPRATFDWINPTNSHLLNLSLVDFLPSSCLPENFSNEFVNSVPRTLPLGHHLVYFAPQVPNIELLADGTDVIHSPGGPYVRRMWAGGSFTFVQPQSLTDSLVGSSRHQLLEGISDVLFKGEGEDEKIFITLDRTYLKHIETSQRPDTTWLHETRNLVFMKKDAIVNTNKILKPTLEPDFTVTMTPTQALLFRFSALTFNAHKIHLDRQYAREVEGHRNLVVHGPLTVVLMLSVLQSQLPPEGHHIVKTFNYRNLAPLYADEAMKICVKKEKRKYEVWIEGKDGGYAVKGSATTT